MKMTAVRDCVAGLLAGAAVVLSGCGAAPDEVEQSAEPPAEVADPPEDVSLDDQPVGLPVENSELFDAVGNLLRPKDHHEWVFVGAPVTPNDMNDGKAAFPEFHNVYINPANFAWYKQTGEFPNGTVILKELVSVGSKSMASGNGYFQGDFVSLEAMVKDTGRFSEEPGGWAFFRFGEAPDYAATGARMKTADCNVCHASAGEDYVFTSTYPVLRAAKKRANKE